MGLLRLIYYKKLMSVTIQTDRISAFDESRAIQNKKFFFTTLGVFTLVIIAFVTHHIHHVNLASVAIGGGFTMMLVSRQDPDEILKEVEWPTLFFFLGLFVLVGGLEQTGFIGKVAEGMVNLTKGDLASASHLVLWVSALSTTIINSIPFTATMISVIENMAVTIHGNIDPLWWALSLGACFGGNGTLVGAAANIIVAGFCQKTKYPLGFKEYAKIGIPLMLVSIVLVTVYLHLRYFL
jgi:Na+/H+ antiporter NhaD/arsenite permease-like protein